MKTKDKLLQARSLLLLDHPFFGLLAMKMPFVPDASIETLLTDGDDIRYNPKHVNSLSMAQTIGTLAHITLHPALGHTWRGSGLNHDAWNKACDYVVNETLLREDFELPKGFLTDGRSNLAAEERYALIRQQPAQPQSKPQPGGKGKGGNKSNKKKKQPGKSDPGRCGAVTPKQDKKSNKKQKAKWKVNIAQVLDQMRRTQGDIPDSIKKDLEDLLNPKIPWAVLLRDFVERSAKNDYNWNRPNRRYMQTGFVLPSLLSEELNDIVIAVDTSGSVIDKLNDFATEISGVLSSYQTRIHLLYCDAAVHTHQQLTTQDLPLKLQAIGGGGTNFNPVFDYIQEHGITPSCLIYLTDLLGSFPTTEPDYPLLWVSSLSDKKAPIGDTVYI